MLQSLMLLGRMGAAEHSCIIKSCDTDKLGLMVLPFSSDSILPEGLLQKSLYAMVPSELQQHNRVISRGQCTAS